MTQIRQMTTDYLYKEETDGIIEAFYDVYNALGYGFLVGDYYADIVVNKHIILELKACASLCREHELQLINYLKSTDIEVGLLLNFGEHPQIRRKLFTNDRKINLRSSV